MNANPERSDTPMSRRGGGSASQATGAAPSTSTEVRVDIDLNDTQPREQSLALRRIEALSAAIEYEEKGVSDATAEKYDKALAAVQQLLKDRGIPSYVIHTHSLKLFGNRRPFPPGERKRYAPELVIHIVIHRGASRAAATVTVGPRSGSYLVSIPNGLDIQVVQHPAEAADLVIAARSGGRT